jgi:hypothetical protein
VSTDPIAEALQALRSALDLSWSSIDEDEWPVFLATLPRTDLMLAAVRASIRAATPTQGAVRSHYAGALRADLDTNPTPAVQRPRPPSALSIDEHLAEIRKLRATHPFIAHQEATPE